MNKEIATFAGGCFWCTEALFKRIDGVLSVAPGYAGGIIENPTYQQVCSGTTGHAEAIQIEFDPDKISYKELLEIFWDTHDPTTLNKQGNDLGPQYRSVIFYNSKAQQQIAEKLKSELEKKKIYKDRIVTEILPFTNFYIAEDYHKNYYEEHHDLPYCNLVISPKIHKLFSKYQKKIKEIYK